MGCAGDTCQDGVLSSAGDRNCPRTADQPERAGTFLCEPPRSEETEATRPSGHELPAQLWDRRGGLRNDGALEPRDSEAIVRERNLWLERGAGERGDPPMGRATRSGKRRLPGMGCHGWEVVWRRA